MKYYLSVLLLLSVASCTSRIANRNQEGQMYYKVKRVSSPVDPVLNWNEGPWKKAELLELSFYMGDRPRHFPKTRAKLLYDQDDLYVLFKVEDQYIRAVAENNQDFVCQDSCVEFFFTPSENLADGYFNLEVNCGGLLFMHHQTGRQENDVAIAEEDYQKIKTYPSMPKRVYPEITEPTTWFLEYVIPFEMLEKYAPVVRPDSGVKWRANFYKCAGKSSHPHWLTWSPVDNPTPDFHLPADFGLIEFE